MILRRLKHKLRSAFPTVHFCIAYFSKVPGSRVQVPGTPYEGRTKLRGAPYIILFPSYGHPRTWPLTPGTLVSCVCKIQSKQQCKPPSIESVREMSKNEISPSIVCVPFFPPARGIISPYPVTAATITANKLVNDP
jgi:hypothetical protein